jgi:hypothetical protein
MHRRRWIIAPLTAVMLLLGLTFGAGPAAAAERAYGQACNYDSVTFNACLNIFPNTLGIPYSSSVDVGIDLKMSWSEAGRTMRRGSSFGASLYSTANGRHFIRTLDLPSNWPRIIPTGLSAHFDFDAAPNDTINYVGGDNAFQAEIVFFEVRADGTTSTHTYKTGIIHGSLPVCLFLCPA